MTLAEAIAHANEKAEDPNCEYRGEHGQLAAWFTELQLFRALSPKRSLLPEPVVEDPNAVAILGMWVAGENQGLHVSLNPKWEDPGTWGIALVDVIKHLAHAYENVQEIAPADTIRRIRELINKEFSNPTDTPRGETIREH